MERERVTVSATEFARIVGVDHAAVFRALKNGVRLKNSIIKVNGKIRIAVCDGCVEWVSSKDERKDHRGGTTYDPVNGIMPREISSEMDRHYSALMKQIEYGRACNCCLPRMTLILPYGLNPRKGRTRDRKERKNAERKYPPLCDRGGKLSVKPQRFLSAIKVYHSNRAGWQESSKDNPQREFQ